MKGGPHTSSPEFVVVGHIARDLTTDGYRLGGTASYAAITARNLGARVGVVTSHGPDVAMAEPLAGIDVIVATSEKTTTFENVYGPNGRQQWVKATASPLGEHDIPADWRAARVILLAPLVGEIDVGLGHRLSAPIVAATPQGWLREWAHDGLVKLKGWDSVFDDRPPAPIVIVSDEDVQSDEGVIGRLASQCKILVVTRGAAGASLYTGGAERRYPAFSVREIDPTGAGDVFAAAFLWRLALTENAEDAVVYANCAASFAVESEGVLGCPTAEKVAGRLRNHIAKAVT